MPSKMFQVCGEGDFVSEDYAAATRHEDETGHTVFGETRSVPDELADASIETLVDTVIRLTHMIEGATWPDAIREQRALVRAEIIRRNEALVSALDRTERNFILAVEGKPVRDMAETLAENQAAR